MHGNAFSLRCLAPLDMTMLQRRCSSIQTYLLYRKVAMFDSIRRLFGGTPWAATQPVARGEPVAPVFPRALVIIHDPPVERYGGRRLHEIFGWNDPQTLARQYAADLREASHGFLNYQIVATEHADWHPAKIDGFRYTNDSFIAAWQAKKHREPNAVDYPAQVRAHRLIERFNAGEFDEAWFFAHPYNGDYESTMVGPGAFWCNSPPVAGTNGAARRFVIMAFNYERGVDCMLENYGHRAESIMSRVYEGMGRGENTWQRFIRYDLAAPGRAECGNVHFAPNSARDYDWGNRRPVRSYCDDWQSYPHLPGSARAIDCREWGSGDMRLHHLWWFSHFPHVAGQTDGVFNNWWAYVVDPNLVT